MKNKLLDIFNTLIKNKQDTPQEKAPDEAKEDKYFYPTPPGLSALDKINLAYKSIQRKPPEKAYAMQTADGKKVALDSNDSSYSNYETDFVKPLLDSSAPDIIYDFFARRGFIGFEACAILKQNWIINNACNIPAQDAIRPGFKLVVTEGDKLSTEELSKIEDIAVQEFHILDVCALAVEKKKVFGSCLIVPRFREDIDMSVPFNPDIVKGKTYKGLIVIEPRWLQFEFEEANLANPLSPDFYEPTWFKMPSTSQLIHKSWCIHLKNTLVPDVLKPTYFYGGIPLTQMIYERVYAAEKVANEAPMLALSKRLLITDVPLTAKLFNRQETEAQIKTLLNYRDNWGVISKRPDATVQQIDTSLSDFESVLMSQYQLVAAIAQVPATKLLKAQPAGMNATGEYDFKDYAQSLQTLQANDMTPIVNLHNKLYTLSQGKEVYINTVFNPIDVPSKAEMAQVNSTQAQLLSNLVAAGIISADEARDVLRSDDNSDFEALSDAPAPENSNEEADVNQLLAAMKQGKPQDEEKDTDNQVEAPNAERGNN